MDAPKGRYRVEEKDGRLVVIDTATGAPIDSPGPAASGPAPRGPSRPAGPVAPPPPGIADRYRPRSCSTSRSTAGTKRAGRSSPGSGSRTGARKALGRGARRGVSSGGSAVRSPPFRPSPSSSCCRSWRAPGCSGCCSRPRRRPLGGVGRSSGCSGRPAPAAEPCPRRRKLNLRQRPVHETPAAPAR